MNTRLWWIHIQKQNVSPIIKMTVSTIGKYWDQRRFGLLFLDPARRTPMMNVMMCTRLTPSRSPTKFVTVFLRRSVTMLTDKNAILFLIKSARVNPSQSVPKFPSKFAMSIIREFLSELARLFPRRPAMFPTTILQAITPTPSMSLSPLMFPLQLFLLLFQCHLYPLPLHLPWMIFLTE